MDAAALLSAIVESSNDAIVGKSLRSIVLSWNDAAERIFGWSAEEIIGQSIRILIPSDRQDEEDRILASVGRGERVPNFETLRLRKDGTTIWISVTVSPVRDRNGVIIAASKIARDITQQRQAARQIELLMMEVNHRSKNLLAVIQSLARRTVAQGGDFVDRFEARIEALSANQDVLVNRSWSSVPVAEVVEAQLEFLGLSRAQVIRSGPDVSISPAATESISMALHEMATNATKYGALSVAEGRIAIEWAIEDTPGCPDKNPQFALSWRESGGPPVVQPNSAGFGSTIIVDVPRNKLRGAVELGYPPEGFRWRFTCPAENALA